MAKSILAFCFCLVIGMLLATIEAKAKSGAHFYIWAGAVLLMSLAGVLL